MTDNHEKIMTLFGEWVSYYSDTTGGISIRTHKADDGRIEIHELFIKPGGAITTDLIRAIPLGKIEAWCNRNMNIATIDTTLGTPKEQATRQATITIPRRTRRYPDSFYEEVAAVYTRLITDGEKVPARTIAAHNHVPVTTVHRWLKEARRREILGAGRKEKLG